MFQRIVVAVDGSEASARAVDAAIDLVAGGGQEVRVVHFLERDVTRFGAVPLEEEGEGQRLVEEAAARIRQAGVAVEGEVRTITHGNAAPEILSSAELFQADVIVMGSRGLGGFGALVLGSVAYKVIHHATVPVLVAR